MILHVTWKCNLKCQYCYLDIEEDKIEMPLEKLVDVIKQFSQRGGLFLDVTGGEPLMRSDITEILRTGYEERLRVTLVTNGTLITDRTIINIKDYVDQVTLSLDGFEEIHDKLRGKGSFNKVYHALRVLSCYGIPTGVTTVVTERTITILSDFYRFLKDLGVQQWNLTLLRATGKARKMQLNAQSVYLDSFLQELQGETKLEVVIDEFLLSPKLREKLKEFYKRKDYARWHNTLTILPNGNCVACVFFPKIVYGNVTQQGLKEIYNSPFRKAVLEKKKPCNVCPLAIYKD